MKKSAHDLNPTRSGWLRFGLSLLIAPVLATGLWALLAPRSFYEDFPAAGRYWVPPLGPYNKHLVNDVGAFYTLPQTFHVEK